MMSDTEKKAGKTETFVIRMTPETLRRLDDARRHIDSLPSRAELVRSIIEEWLAEDEAKR